MPTPHNRQAKSRTLDAARAILLACGARRIERNEKEDS